MAEFSVLLFTASPPFTAGDSGGAMVKIDGRESLMKCAELFLNRDNVKQIQICFLPEAAEQAKQKFGSHLSFTGVKALSAGPKWIDQVAAAAGRIDASCTHVIVHDAARPAVPYTDIDALLEMGPRHEAVTLAAPLRNALIEVDEGGNPMAFHSASRYFQFLTPTCFSKEKFLEVGKNRQEPHASSFVILKASALNVRVSSAGEASLVKAMIGLMPKPKIKGPANPFDEAQW